MTSKKQHIIHAITELDISKLEVLLDEDKTYQDTTKEMFISKLSEAFIKFKESKDDSLYFREGKCGSKLCKNRGCKGYTFIGNNSRLHMDLIFEESNNEIVDIYHCNDFSSSEVRIKSMQVYINVKEDEKVAKELLPDLYEEEIEAEMFIEHTKRHI